MFIETFNVLTWIVFSRINQIFFTRNFPRGQTWPIRESVCKRIYAKKTTTTTLRPTFITVLGQILFFTSQK